MQPARSSASKLGAFAVPLVLLLACLTEVRSQTFFCYDSLCSGDQCAETYPPNQAPCDARKECFTQKFTVDGRLASVRRSCTPFMPGAVVGCRISITGQNATEDCYCRSSLCNGKYDAPVSSPPLKCAQCDYKVDNDCSLNPVDDKYTVTCPTANSCALEIDVINGYKKAIRYCANRNQTAPNCFENGRGHTTCFCVGDKCNNVDLTAGNSSTDAATSTVAPPPQTSSAASASDATASQSAAPSTIKPGKNGARGSLTSSPPALVLLFIIQSLPLLRRILQNE